MSITMEQVRGILIEVSRVIQDNKQYLTDLDAAIGDGDHGLNMARGFAVVDEKLAGPPPATAGDLFKTVAMALISHVGGASGPLYGTFFLKASAAVKDRHELELSDLCALMREGVAGVQARGKAVLGEKTMLDVLIPVQQCLEEAVAGGVSGPEALRQAAALARRCAEGTKEIRATKGRASYLGERSIGHIDPGAMSSCLMLETVAACLSEGA